jgi:hypothetical protein
MRSKEELRKLEFEKFKDDAVIWREREAAVSALNFSTFLAAVGPLSITLLKFTNGLPVGATLAYVIMGTAPFGLVLTVINWIRTPADYRHAKPVVRALFLSIGAAALTFILAGVWGLMKG